MATRLLLTLLALFTGLAAQMSPAQARIRAEGTSEIGTFAAIVRSEHAAVARPATRIRTNDQGIRIDRCTIVVMRQDANCAPPVMLGIDRARE